MTQVITRYFESESKAYSTKRRLQFERFPRKDLWIFTDPDGLVETLTSENVAKATAEGYAKRLASDGGAVFLAKATYKPLGVAKLTRQVTADMGAADMGGLVEEVYVKDRPGKKDSILTEHPLILSRARDHNPSNYYMADWPIPLISRRKPMDESVFPRHARMANWPIPLLSKRKPSDNFAFSRHARMAAFPIPLLSKRTPSDKFAFPRHARMAAFPIPLLSKRKPSTSSMIGRHARMANWPFPHLINGKTGTNALVPGGKRMANFPISLISKREPMSASIFSKHARMASFPIPLLSKRKPFTGSMVPRHGRMADAFLPLVIKHAESKSASGHSGFSFSRLFGLPTLKRR